MGSQESDSWESPLESPLEFPVESSPFPQHAVVPADSVSSRQPSSTEAVVPARIGQTRRYLDNGDGTVTDPETGLQWMRCSLGQTWNGADCVGSADEYTWDAAMAAADEFNQRGGYAGYRDWRVPTIEELNSLVYCSNGNPGLFPFVGKRDTFGCEGECQTPTIDLEAFPNTPADFFWSAAPCAGHLACAWDVDFYNGYGYWSLKIGSSKLRLVRRGQ